MKEPRHDAGVSRARPARGLAQVLKEQVREPALFSEHMPDSALAPGRRVVVSRVVLRASCDVSFWVFRLAYDSRSVSLDERTNFIEYA